MWFFFQLSNAIKPLHVYYYQTPCSPPERHVPTNDNNKTAALLIYKIRKNVIRDKQEKNYIARADRNTIIIPK